MNTQRLIRTSLAGAIACGLFGVASIAAAQQTPAPPPPPPQTQTQTAPPMQTQSTPSPQRAATQFYQGTESSATYPLADSNGGTLTVHAGMPAHTAQYGPPPAFGTLDTNHDGRISEAEARAYPPLDSDFLYASGGAKSISKAQYKRWARSPR